MFASSSFTRKIDAPPIPSSGFKIMSLCSAKNSRICFWLRVTKVSGVCSLNHAVNSFSLASRKLCGLLIINVPSSSARSKRYVAYMYSVSNGGSLRIKITSRSARAMVFFSSSSYHFSSLLNTRALAAVAYDLPLRSDKSSISI